MNATAAGHATQGFVRASDGLSSISGKLNDLIAQLVRAATATSPSDMVGGSASH